MSFDKYRRKTHISATRQDSHQASAGRASGGRREGWVVFQPMGGRHLGLHTTFWARSCANGTQWDTGAPPAATERQAPEQRTSHSLISSIPRPPFAAISLPCLVFPFHPRSLPLLTPVYTPNALFSPSTTHQQPIRRVFVLLCIFQTTLAPVNTTHSLLYRCSPH